MSDLTGVLAAHAANFPATAVPAAVREHLALDLADHLAVTIGGVRAEGVAETRALIAAEAADGAARVFGVSLSLAASAAAQANATAAHALDYDDTLDEGGGMHAGAPVHAAALALADEMGGVRGEAYVAAAAVGLDVAVRLALAPTEDFGWHRTSAFGIFGAAVAAGRLLGLDERGFANALGIAASLASGNRQCIADGALTKRLQAGFAARDGLLAARLAERGLTGPARAFEGRDGFFNLYQRGAYDRSVTLEGLGQTLLSPRISLKPYPCGRNLHALVEAALNARAAARAPIRAVRIALPPRAAAHARLDWPSHVVEAQFSAPFAASVALALGRTPLIAFDRPAEVDASVRDIFDRVTIEAGEGLAAGALVEVELETGERISRRTDVAPGSRSRPLDAAAIRAKFSECNAFAAFPLSQEQSALAFGAALGVGELASTRTLTALLQPQVEGARQEVA